MAPRTYLPLLLVVIVLHTSFGQECSSNQAIYGDDRIKVSSSAPKQGKELVGFDCCKDKVGAAWCPDPSDQHPFLEVHLQEEVPVGMLIFQPPKTDAFSRPKNFMKSFRLSVKLKGIPDLIQIQEDIYAITNETVGTAMISIKPPIITDLIRIEPKDSQGLACFRMDIRTCEKSSLCKKDWCKNGGECTGFSTCNCTVTNNFGERCEFDATSIPMTSYNFVGTTATEVKTITDKFTYKGSISVEPYGSSKLLVLNPQSTVEITGTEIASCLADPDKCSSGFSISVVFSLTTNPKKTEYPFILTSTGAQPSEAKGLALYFNNDEVHCMMGTSNQVWLIESVFKTVAMKWYEMTISWSSGRGLLLMSNGVVIGSALRPGTRPTSVTKTKTLTLGVDALTTTSKITISSMKSVLLFWSEAERAGITREPIPAGWSEPVCFDKLGMESGKIKTSQISVSSSMPNHGKEKARAGCCQNEQDGAWCAAHNDKNPWIQVDLTEVTALSAISFQLPGRVSDKITPSNFVKEVRIEYRDMSRDQSVYIPYSDGVPAAKNATVAYFISLSPRVVTDSVRLYIIEQHGDACFRFDLVGCQVTDLCQKDYCTNGGKCSGDRKCSCPDGFYGARCEKTKTDIASKDVGFTDKVNNTIITTDPNVVLTTKGDVTLVMKNSINVIKLNNGGTITFPDDDCLRDLTRCLSGFTLTVDLELTTIQDELLSILTTDNGKGSQGITLIYSKTSQLLIFTVTSGKFTWIVTTSFKLMEKTWHKLTVTWSPSAGSAIIVDGKLTGSVFGGKETSVPATLPSAPLCFGCGAKVTSTILIKVVTTVHVHITDLTKAHILDFVTTPAPPTTTAPIATTTTTPTTTAWPKPECKSKLGMQSGSIKADQITVSTSLPGHGSEKTRFGCCAGEEDGAWCANPNDKDPWVQVDLKNVLAVSAISFQVPERVSAAVVGKNYAKNVRLEYKDVHSGTYKAYSKGMPAIYNATTAYYTMLNPKITTDSVRIHILESEGTPCFRFEVIGCGIKDLCPKDYCKNGGKCISDMKCSCSDGYYGARCELTKTDIIPAVVGFKDIVNNTITTTDPKIKITTTGHVTVTTNVIQLVNGGAVTFPVDKCLENLDKCFSGFTITVGVKFVKITDTEFIIFTTGVEERKRKGFKIIYNKITETLTFTVKTTQLLWTVTSHLKWQISVWHKLTVTWSPSEGGKIIVDGVVTGSKFGGDMIAPIDKPSKPLCIGCNLINTKITTTVLIKEVSKVNVYITDLITADIIKILTLGRACKANEFTFKSVTLSPSEVVTSLGTIKSHGDVSVISNNGESILELDEQGEFAVLKKTGIPCIDDITSCKSGLTLRITFRFLDFHMGPNFILSSGAELEKSTGISVYYHQGQINYLIKDGKMVWQAIYDQSLDLYHWYTIDVSWGSTRGVELRLDGKVLININKDTHKAAVANEKYPLHLAKTASDDENITSLMEITMIGEWASSMDTLEALKCKEITIKNPEDKCIETMKEVKFKKIEKGHDLLTSLGTMKTYGNVTLEKTSFKQGKVVLVIDDDGEYVDMGKTGVACLDDITSCKSSFNFRLTFVLTKIGRSPSYILSSGGELNNATGISLSYFNNQLMFYVKDGSKMHRKYMDTQLHENEWYTLDASWNAKTSGLSVFIDGIELNGMQFPATPTPNTMDKYSLLIGKSPEKTASTHMNILLFRFWEETRTELVKQGCQKILKPENPPDLTTTPAPPTTTAPMSTDPPMTKTQLVFNKVVGTTLVTSYTNMTIHGTITLVSVPAGNVLVIEKQGSYVDIGKTGVPCLDDIDSCTTGFNFRLTLTLTTLTTDSQVLISSGSSTGTSGLSVKYQSKIIYITVKTSDKMYVGAFPTEMTPGFWFTLDVSWSIRNGVGLHVNNKLIDGTVTNTTVGTSTSSSTTLLLGKAPSSKTTTIMRVFEIDLWTRIHARIPKTQLILPNLKPYVITTPATSTTDLSTTPISTTPTTTSTTTRKPIKVTSFEWTLTKLTTSTTIVSSELSLVIHGKPTRGPNGVMLETDDHYLTIPNVKDMCLTTPSECLNGVTIEVDVKLLELVENTVILTSGAQTPQHPGITLLYRFGFIHVIVSTGSQSWYVSVPRHKITINTFTKIHVSWSVKTKLQLFINNVLVGVSEPPQTHKTNTTTTIDTLTIGGTKTKGIVKEIRIWLVHIQILIDTKVIVTHHSDNPSTTSSPKSSTHASTPWSTSHCSSGCVPIGTICASSPAPSTKPTKQVIITANPDPDTPSPVPSSKKPTPSTAPTKQVIITANPDPDTPSPTPKTTLKSTTTRKPPTPTTTLKSTTTRKPPTTTTTTKAPTTTTPPKCPDIPAYLLLTVMADVNGNSQLICTVPNVPEPNVKVTFTWHVQGIRKTWKNTINAPFTSAALSVSEMGVELYNKKIHCSVTQSLTLPGASDCPGSIDSNTLIPSITVTTTNIVVIEGGDQKLIHVNFPFPPSSLCGSSDKGRCTVQILTQIKTERREIRCDRNEILPQAVFGLTSIWSRGTKGICGVEVTKDNWKNGVNIPVKAVLDRSKDRDQKRVVAVYIKVIGEITRVVTKELQIGVVQVTVIDRDRNAQCSSVNDPHMKTFDGRRYNNFIPGEFVMFQHKTLPYEVRGLYKPCSDRNPKGATCNCGAAVRSGDDVITFNSCNGRRRGRRTAIDVQLYKNGDLTTGTTVRKHGCGQKYEVFLPTGMKVTVSASYQQFINIYITPSSPDFEQSTGLCGNYNGNANDDFGGISSRRVDTFSLQWKRTVTLFFGVKAQFFAPPPVYCSCQNTQQAVCKAGLDVYACINTGTRFTGNDITLVLVRMAKTPARVYSADGQRRRSKRAAGDDPADVLNLEVSAMSRDAALSNCTDYLNNSPILGQCEQYIGNTSIKDSIEECAQDLEALGDVGWARSHLDHLLEECMDTVKQDQVPEEESNSTTPIESPADIIMASLCIDSCGDHGNCSAAVCQCEEGWTGDVCNISKSTKPEVMSATEPCDTVTTSCQEVNIEGDNFVDSPNLTCFFKYEDTESKLMSTADVINMNQVVCKEPDSELKGRNARITISNDGVVESDNSYLRLTYKSSCETCVLNGDEKECTKKTDICRIGGECYERNQPHDKDKTCFYCDPDRTKDAWTRSTEPECLPNVIPVSTEDSESEYKETIVVLAVLLGIMTFIALTAIVVAWQAKWKLKRSLQKSDSVPMSFDILRKNVTDPTRPERYYENVAFDAKL